VDEGYMFSFFPDHFQFSDILSIISQIVF